MVAYQDCGLSYHDIAARATCEETITRIHKIIWNDRRKISLYAIGILARVGVSLVSLESLKAKRNLRRNITIDESWVYHYTPETDMQSKW
ncbi:hypothetical protein LAZ67_2006274 [Cordylochernes scorpioides]|uniref:Uncharacterized protein n=1 Tax=Cordylochernes scorpioides TaxID=51811 RepID=A0ABY6K5C0_9ARAC|nr:hypothetical protein LAZ67_2006274 [Cordylochernes scorpioides]